MGYKEWNSVSLGDDLGYKYPGGLDLRPDSEEHGRLLGMITDRARESADFMSNRHDSWEKVNRNLTAYVPLSEEEEEIKDDDERKPVALVIPRSYAILETLLTYWVAAFGERPVFRYEGMGPEDVAGAMLLELAVNAQMIRAKELVQLHTMWRDSFVYGFGPVALTWESRGSVRRRGRSRIFRLGGSSVGTVPYEGNFLYNIDPYSYLPDVNVPIQDVQRGEYVGWIDRTNLASLLSLEKRSPETFFNVRYVEALESAKSELSVVDSGTGRKDRISDASVTTDYGHPCDVIHEYVNLIPKEWELGDGEYPEKWVFSVVGDEVIIRAEPLDHEHDMFPIAVCAPDFDGHTASPISRLEIVYPLQEAIDFLITSHMANIRKSVNNMFVVDPEILNLNDMVESKAGLLARIRRRYWGQLGAVDKAIKQLTVTDITRANVGDIAVLSDIMRDSTAAVDTLAGMLRKGGERITATEVSGTRMSALSRLEKAARITSIQALYDLGYMIASNTVQYMDDEVFARVVGRWSEDIMEIYGDKVTKERIVISPKDIDVAFDVVPHDGTIPGSADASVMAQMFQIVASQPELYNMFDIPKMFRAIAKSAGAKNIESFVKRGVSARVAPDEEVQRELEKGNLLPLGAKV